MDGTAADTLDRIREGSTYVVAMAIQRLDECKEALQDGDFRMAARHLKEAESRIDPLSSAQVQFSQWNELRVIRGTEIEVGHNIYCWDAVDEIESTYDDPSGDGDTVVVVKGSRGETRRFYGRGEVIVFSD